MITQNRVLLSLFCFAFTLHAQAGSLPNKGGALKPADTQVAKPIELPQAEEASLQPQTVMATQALPEGDAVKTSEAPVIPIVPDVENVIAQVKPSVDPDVTIQKGGPVICIKEGRLSVRTEDLKQVLFYADRLSPVKVFQGWGENKKEKQIDGHKYNFVRVQLPAKEDDSKHEGIGWVAEEYVKSETDCLKTVPPLPKAIEVETLVTPPIKGYDDPNCCGFPIADHPTTSFTTGQRQFGASRAKGRLHAACDIYNKKDEPIIAVAPGSVIRGLYAFYQGTYALEVKHSGGFVVRYGEITGKQAKAISSGAKVKQGQIVGYMGKVNSKCCEPMLHFELYSGKQTGALSQHGKNKYRRRSDLVDPTKYLLRWEQESLN
jgi:murein DD-endopeptidase MepM/ murein hydrolase activator NlpD